MALIYGLPEWGDLMIGADALGRPVSYSKAKTVTRDN
jgi:hypothetical protein